MPRLTIILPMMHLIIKTLTDLDLADFVHEDIGDPVHQVLGLGPREAARLALIYLLVLVHARDLILDGLEILLIELAQVHQDEFVVRLVQEQHLLVLFL